MGLTGGFDELPLADLVEMATLGRKTGRLTVFDEGGKAAGELDFRAGRLVGARCGGLGEEKAFYALLAVKTGTFAFDSDVDPQGPCDLPTESLLMESMRRLDETRLLREQLPDHATVRLLGGEAQDQLEARVLGYLAPADAGRLGHIVKGLLTAGDCDEYDALHAVRRLAEREIIRVEPPGNRGGPSEGLRTTST